MSRIAPRTIYAGRRHSLLLVLLLTGVIIQSSGTSTAIHPLLHDMLQTAIALTTFFVTFEGGRARTAAGALLVVLLALGWGRHVAPPHLFPLLSAAQAVVAGAFFWVAVGAILHGLFTRPGPGSEKIAGAACGYLLAGAAWAPVNALIYQFAPETFTMDPRVAALLADWGARSAIWSFYSYTQMLTIGYADITPVRAPATTASLFGALFGVFYTAVVVSQFVSLAQAPRPRGE